MKVTEQLKLTYQDILSLKSNSAEPNLSAEQIARINDFTQAFCKHAIRFGITIVLEQTPLNSSKMIVNDNIKNIFTVFDYVCYLDIYLSDDTPDLGFPLNKIEPEFTGNPLIRRDLVLKIQAYLNKVLKVLAETDSADPKIQVYLILFNQTVITLRTLTFRNHSNPSSIDDLITNIFIKLMIISFTMNIVDLDVCEPTTDFDVLKCDSAALLKLLAEIHDRTTALASAPSIFNTCFNNHYYGLGITEYEQLRIQAIAISNDLDDLIKEHLLVTGPEESAPSAESDSIGIHNLPADVSRQGSAEVIPTRSATPVQQKINPILGNSPISFPSPGLSGASDVPTPLYCVGGAGVQWTPPRHRIVTSDFNISTPDPAGRDRLTHCYLYTPVSALRVTEASTGDLSIKLLDTPQAYGITSSSAPSPADILEEPRKGLLSYSRQLREQGPAVRLDLDASVEVNPADLSGVVELDHLPPTIPGHSADTAEGSRTNGHKL